MQISLLIQTRTLFHWRKRYYVLWTLWYFSLKNVLMMDLFELLSSPDVNWWIGVVWITCGLLWCFYQLFGLSFWRHPFTAEHPLLRHWCSDISTNLMKKQTHPNLRWSEGEHIFSRFDFCLNYSFKHTHLWQTRLMLQTLSGSLRANDLQEILQRKASSQTFKINMKEFEWFITWTHIWN